MIVGLDIGAQWVGPRTGIGRYMAALAVWLPKAAPETRVEVFLDRRPEMVNEEEWAALRAMFPAATVRACSGRLPVYAPSATRKARRWRIGPLLRPLDPIVQRLCEAVNEGASPWARAIKRLRCPPDAGRAEVVHIMLRPSYPWRRRGNVMTIHDIIPLTNPEWVPAPDVRRMRAQLDFARRYCQAVITDSEFVRGQLLARGLDPERVTAVPLACAPAFRPRDPAHQAACRAAVGSGSRRSRSSCSSGRSTRARTCARSWRRVRRCAGRPRTGSWWSGKIRTARTRNWPGKAYCTGRESPMRRWPA